MSDLEVGRWKLIPERIAELRERVNDLFSTLNIYECVAMRDMLTEGMQPKGASLTSNQKLNEWMEDWRDHLPEQAVAEFHSLVPAHETSVGQPASNLEAFLKRVEKHFGPPREGTLKSPYFIHESEWVELRQSMRSVHETSDRPVAYLHEITEPDGNTTPMYSASKSNPWSHWTERHKERCKYKCTPLYSRPAVETADSLPKARAALASLYQVVGSLAGELNVFDTPDVQAALDVGSRWEQMSVEEIEALLPWPKAMDCRAPSGHQGNSGSRSEANDGSTPSAAPAQKASAEPIADHCEKHGVVRFFAGGCPQCYHEKHDLQRENGTTALCPDGLVPDGERCPRCGCKRGPSGIGGGTWVHIERAAQSET